ncbi:MAG: hypothetical protein M0008_00340, partial [Actinomycetota bacterium]|nr:hypothetical protein [Actinomycetota bacterium]
MLSLRGQGCLISLFVSANSALHGRDSEHRTGLVNGGDASCLLTVGSSGINKSMLDLEGAAS